MAQGATGEARPGKASHEYAALRAPTGPFRVGGVSLEARPRPEYEATPIILR